MVYITTIDPVDKKKKRITGSADVEGSVPMHVKVVNQVASAVNTPVKVSGATDPTAVFANSALVNTQATAITITAPEEIRKYHRLIVHNPSTESDLTVKVWNKAGIGSVTKQFMGSCIIPAKGTVTGTSIETDARNIFQDLFLGGCDVELQVSNNQVLGGSGGFTATIQLYSL